MKRILLTAMLMAVSVLPARADVVFDQWWGGADLWGVTCSSGAAAAIKFTPTDNYVVTSAEFRMSGGGSYNGYTVLLMEDSGGAPGTVIATASGGVNWDYTSAAFTTKPEVKAGTQYWLGVTSASTMDWMRPHPATAGTGPAYTYATGSVGSWSLVSDNYIPLIARVNGTRTPEPGTLVLVGAGLALVGRQRKRSRAARGA